MKPDVTSVTKNAQKTNNSYSARYAAATQTSPENIISEIEELITNYQRREFNFHDDLFTENKKRLKRFCELIIEKKLNIIWVCMSRADYIKPEILKLMK